MYLCKYSSEKPKKTKKKGTKKMPKPDYLQGFLQYVI